MLKSDVKQQFTTALNHLLHGDKQSETVSYSEHHAPNKRRERTLPKRQKPT